MAEATEHFNTMYPVYKRFMVQTDFSVAIQSDPEKNAKIESFITKLVEVLKVNIFEK